MIDESRLRFDKIPATITGLSLSAELLETVYQELRHIAAFYLRHERRDHTLQPTALVHEAYLRLTAQDQNRWNSREHFIAVSAMMMRRVLVNHAIGRRRAKRGCGEFKLSIEDVSLPSADCNLDLIDLDRALDKMAEEYPRESQIVELRFFGGMSISEVARILGVSDTTVERSWRFARVWLFRELSRGQP